MPEELFQAHFTPVQTRGEGNAFARAVPRLSSPMRDRPTIPALALAERGGGRHKPFGSPIPTSPPAHAAPLQEGSHHREAFQTLPFTGAEQTALPLLSSLQSSVGKSLISTQRKSITV